MENKEDEYNILKKRVFELKKLFLNSSNLGETVDKNENSLKSLENGILDFAKKYSWKEADELFEELFEIKNEITEFKSENEDSTNGTLSIMFGDELENDDFPDSFDMDDFFGLD